MSKNAKKWVNNMFINKAADGSNNLCGDVVAARRKALGFSQRELADRLQLMGMEIDKNGVQRMEAGKRFVTDIELVFLSRSLDLSFETLLKQENER